MALWNDRRTPPGRLTDLSVQMGAQYRAPQPAPPALNPEQHRMAEAGIKPARGKPKTAAERRAWKSERLRANGGLSMRPDA